MCIDSNSGVSLEMLKRVRKALYLSKMVSLPEFLLRAAKQALIEARAPYYIRFGDIPKSGTSSNHMTTDAEGGIAQGFEQGISVYDAGVRVDGKGYYVINPEQENASYSLPNDYWNHMLSVLFLQRILEGSIFLVRGTKMKKPGADGEPLLRTVEIVKRLDPHEVFIGSKTVNWIRQEETDSWVKQEKDQSEPISSYFAKNDGIRKKRAEELEDLDIAGSINLSPEERLLVSRYSPNQARELDAIWQKHMNALNKKKGKISPL